jgi:hypothetical protein
MKIATSSTSFRSGSSSGCERFQRRRQRRRRRRRQQQQEEKSSMRAGKACMALHAFLHNAAWNTAIILLNLCIKNQGFSKISTPSTQWSQGTKARHSRSVDGESDDESSLRLFTTPVQPPLNHNTGGDFTDDDGSDCSLQAQQQGG